MKKNDSKSGADRQKSRRIGRKVGNMVAVMLVQKDSSRIAFVRFGAGRDMNINE